MAGVEGCTEVASGWRRKFVFFNPLLFNLYEIYASYSPLP